MKGEVTAKELRGVAVAEAVTAFISLLKGDSVTLTEGNKKRVQTGRNHTNRSSVFL